MRLMRGHFFGQLPLYLQLGVLVEQLAIELGWQPSGIGCVAGRLDGHCPLGGLSPESRDFPAEFLELVSG